MKFVFDQKYIDKQLVWKHPIDETHCWKKEAFKFYNMSKMLQARVRELENYNENKTVQELDKRDDSWLIDAPILEVDKDNEQIRSKREVFEEIRLENLRHREKLMRSLEEGENMLKRRREEEKKRCMPLRKGVVGKNGEIVWHKIRDGPNSNKMEG